MAAAVDPSHVAASAIVAPAAVAVPVAAPLELLALLGGVRGC